MNNEKAAEICFADMNIPQSLKDALAEMDYKTATPVQAAVYEPASAGKDLVVQARTGTGKTTAFGLPLIGALVKASNPNIQAIVLSPTRELALQICRELTRIASKTSLKITAVYGGAPMGKQIDALNSKDGCQIVVGTPGRVLDHLKRGTLNPSTVGTFVLDEADEMLSMGFLPQIQDIWGRLPKASQTLLFSATVPREIMRVAESRLRTPEYLTLSGDHVGALEIQHYVYLSHGNKTRELLQVLDVEAPQSAIIFCNTRDVTKSVSAQLQQAGYNADWLNADLGQSDRERVMAAVRDGSVRFLVCTDVAARGIDISHLSHVINYDFPENTESYVHRTGRTGRAGRLGTAISLISPAEIGNLYYLRLTYKIFPVERHLPSQEELRSQFEADVIRQLRSDMPSNAHPSDLSLAKRLLTVEDAESLIAGLLRAQIGEDASRFELATKARRAKAPSPIPPTLKNSAKKASKGGANSNGNSPRATKSSTAPAEVKSEAPKAKSAEDAVNTPPAQSVKPSATNSPTSQSAAGPSATQQTAKQPASEVPSNQGRAANRRSASQESRPPERNRDEKRGRMRQNEDDEIRFSVSSREPSAAEIEEALAHSARHRPNSAKPEASTASEAPRAPAPRQTPPVKREVVAEQSAEEESFEGDENLVDLFVGIGRRQGARSSSIRDLLDDRGIPESWIGKIHVRQRHSFISVAPEHAETIVEKANGALFDGEAVLVELSRRAKELLGID